ncbi:opioid growth factor receptor-like protein 1 isoform X1 [Neoarius graeffei]|uniref:opioid growth factor receptor-like protein 1 isoform X1 n=1 Tax=Neoarius graeffei TaxID=443677 RepID=UPI00298BDB74|nr:opioid growth factor receptor-like protein 1 isoform X1 [Neoarius graeffei]
MNMGNSENKDFDSTWEDEDDNEDTTESSPQWSWSAQRNMHAAEDMQKYRHKYRMIQLDDMKDHDLDNLQDEVSPNLWFYQNKIPFDADGKKKKKTLSENIDISNNIHMMRKFSFFGVHPRLSSLAMCIENFHMYWFGDYNKLEHDHSYIQWLFPIHEKGMNTCNALSDKEIKLFRRDEEVKKRLLTSYKLMLDFYGIELLSEETGEVKRAVNWKERFANLNGNPHNNLRITRILKCLGLLGFHHYQAPLVHFFLVETLVKGTLARVKQSILDYFMFAVVDKSKRRELIKFALCYFEPKEKFVWCPRRIRIKFLNELERAQKETELP